MTGDAIFNVTANVPWDITQASPVSWITTISPDNRHAIIKPLPSHTKKIPQLSSRDAVLTLAATETGATETL